MQSLTDTIWDVVISGTGLHQALLALALSRSNKNILHIDSSDYYGGNEASLSLQDAETWVAEHASPDTTQIFRAASITRPEASAGLSFPRAYSLTLSPQLIHTRSTLISQLVSSRAFRQLEFLAVGSFFIFQTPSETSARPSLARIPSTREDVFLNSAISARAKRSLMKFLKFVLEYDSEPQTDIWQPLASEPLSFFLASKFNLDEELRAYVLALTLSPNGDASVKDGLEAIHRHLTSMGVFGAGFVAVYPKWGGASEVAQVSCRAAAVGGAVYMLNTGVGDVRKDPEEADDAKLQISLTSGTSVTARKLIRGARAVTEGRTQSRLVAIINSDLSSLFEVVVEGAPKPAVAVISFPAGSPSSLSGASTSFPVYVLAHSSETGECPAGQSVLYLSTLTTTAAKALLQTALDSLLAAITGEDGPAPQCLYQLYYEQSHSDGDLAIDGNILTFPATPLNLSFDDSVLESVRKAWVAITGRDRGGEDDGEYMVFEDREGVSGDDDPYD